MKLMHRDSRARAQRDPDSSSRPAPWTAEGRTATAAAVHARWAGAIGSASSSQWQDWQEWNSWGQQNAPWTDTDWKGKGKRYSPRGGDWCTDKRARLWAWEDLYAQG
eukprot:811357-Pyramimonas_sp.AAC.1